MTVNSKQAISTRNEEMIVKLKTESGMPVIGYICCFAPPELIAAAGALPYRITGIPGADNSAADAYVEPYGCTYVRNILARAVKGELDYLDGLVISHSCDMVQRLYGIWTYYHPLAYSYMFNVPHQLTPWSKRFFKRELGFFKESLEKYTGNEITNESLRKAIDNSNLNRKLIRKLYNMRKEDKPLFEGSEIIELLIDGGTLPAEQFRKVLEEKLAEAENREAGKEPKPRIMIWGSIMDDPSLFKMIEETGGTVITDDTCIGTRVWDKDIPLTDDLYDGLTSHYFENFQCPRTDRGPGVKRFDYLLERAREYRVNGVVGYCISFCDPHKFDYPDLRDLLKKERVPFLLIDDNYSFEPAGSIRTRLQAFIEML